MTQKLELEQLTALLARHPVPCALFTGQGQPVWMHPGLAEIVRKPEKELAAMTMADIEGHLKEVPGGLVQADSGIYTLMKTGITVGTNTFEARYFLDASAQSESKVLRERLQQEAMVDADTGLLTYPALIKNLDLLVTRSRRYGNPVALLKIQVTAIAEDIPPVDMLTSVGHLLKDQLRWADLIGRTEDDRFIIILPETTIDAAETIAGKLRESLKSLTVPYAGGVACQVRACYGMTAWRKGDDSSLVLRRLQEAVNQAVAAANEDLVAK